MHSDRDMQMHLLFAFSVYHYIYRNEVQDGLHLYSSKQESPGCKAEGAACRNMVLVSGH